MASTTKSNRLVQSNVYPPVQIRFYRPSDWEQLRPIFVAGVRVFFPAAVTQMYTWPRFYPVYALVGGGLGWLGRGVWNIVNELGRRALPRGAVEVGRVLVENWTWKESVALGSIGLGLVIWGALWWKMVLLFDEFIRMSLNDDMKDIAKHYGLERPSFPLKGESKGQEEYGEWKPKGASAFWVAEVGDEVVGCIGLDQRDDGPYGSAGELRRMSVSPRFQRRGIGRRLLEQLLDHAKGTGLREVYLTTTQYHVSAISLYKKAGFEIVKYLPLVGTARVLMLKLDL